MTKQQYLEKIIEVCSKFNKGSMVELTADTLFGQIPHMDSMSIVDFQIQFRKLLGEDAKKLPRNFSGALLSMKLSEFAELCESFK